MPSRIAFSTLAFPDATLAAAASAGLGVAIGVETHDDFSASCAVAELLAG